MKEAVTNVIDTLTQEDFHGAFQKFLERYRCIAAWGDYFRRGLEFRVCTINKSAHTKKSGNLFNLILGFHTVSTLMIDTSDVDLNTLFHFKLFLAAGICQNNYFSLAPLV